MGIRTQVGTMSCLVCGQDIPIKQSEGGAITIGCTWCDLKGWAAEGSQAHKLLAAKIKPAPAPPPAPVSGSPNEPPKPPKPAAPGGKQKTVFG